MAFEGPRGDALHTLRSDGRLRARPDKARGEKAGPKGLHPLGLGGKRDGLLYVPEDYSPEKPAALVVMLHGAGGNARQTLGWLQDLADTEGFLLLAPESRAPSWDLVMGDYGQDVAFLDQVLDHVFERYAVDPERVVLAGFSDGASYALSLGIINGDLFRHIMAFSPGFAAPRDSHGTPRLFISHGDKDGVLPVARYSRRIVPQLEAAGLDVRYHEFKGGHVIPPEVVGEAIDWLNAAGGR
ncbi:alpha/beta hydrolase [Myxococcus sp. RHSTA-1-4]|uniref:alpha/beta hydrolase n=1 Tax=Myxococcus sp. RHSTA-1-4 TaxID=2874601 RepID=UPI001CBEF465|nr:alpha/beta hydrolase-fold protein [Myxococcus sp. RHSTA-1-4]MBZ4418856.1 phospholipase [Myxococcus sp. RHSTA-1-4]